MLTMRFCAVSPEKEEISERTTRVAPHIIAYFAALVKGESTVFVRENSIFIDEKIYSVDRVKKIR